MLTHTSAKPRSVESEATQPEAALVKTFKLSPDKQFLAKLTMLSASI